MQDFMSFPDRGSSICYMFIYSSEVFHIQQCLITHPDLSNVLLIPVMRRKVGYTLRE